MIWEDLANKVMLDIDIIKLVSDGLRSQLHNELLQPVQLKLLVLKNINELKGKDFNALATMAREDASSLGRKWNLEGRTFRNVVISFAIGATTIVPLNKSELIYIISESELFPGYIDVNENHRGYQWGVNVEDRSDISSFPVYHNLRTQLFSDEIDCLDHLERYGYIERYGSGFRFSHTNYMRAALFVFVNSSIDDNVRMIKRGLACLDPHTAVSAAKAIRYIINDEILHTGAISQNICDVAISGYRSIFPAVKDTLASFLVSRLDMLPTEYKKTVVEHVNDNDDVNFVFWKYGSPWINPDAPGRWSGYNRHSEIALHAALLLTDRSSSSRVSPEHAWYASNDIYKLEGVVNTDFLAEQLLSYDEVFIRKMASMYIADRLMVKRIDLFMRALQDEHPLVVVYAFIGAFYGWSAINGEYRTKYTNLLIKAISLKCTPLSRQLSA